MMYTMIIISNFINRYGMLLKPIIVLAALLSLSGCVMHQKLTPILDSAQTTKYEQNIEYVVSQKKYDIALAYLGNDSSTMSFVVLLRNRSKNSFNFSTDDISITDGGNRFIKVFSYDELMQQEQSRLAWKSFGVAMDNLNNSMRASNVGNNYGSGSAYHSNGVYSTYNMHYYDSGAAYNAQALANIQNQANSDRFKREAHASITALQNTLLKRQTVGVGMEYGGVIKTGLPAHKDEPRVITFKITLPNDVHIFKYSY